MYQQLGLRFRIEREQEGERCEAIGNDEHFAVAVGGEANVVIVKADNLVASGGVQLSCVWAFGECLAL